MKFTKKGVAIAAAALVLSASAAFAEVSFTNKVKSGIVDLTFMGREADPAVSVDFGGISERIEAEYTSDKLNFGADGELTLDNQPGPMYVYSNASEITRFLDLKWTDLDFYLEFRPWNFLTLFLSDDIYTPGSYMPVVGFSMGSGNMGSDLGVMVTPINGLRITAGLDVISYFGGDPENDKDVWTDEKISEGLPKVNVAADYTYKNIWSAGLVARNILNWSPYTDCSIGLFGSFTGFEGWALYSGVMFNHNYDWYWDVNDQYPNANIVGFINEYRVEGLILFDFGLSCWNDKISVDFDLSTNFGFNRDVAFDGRFARMGGKADFGSSEVKAKQYKHFYDQFDLYAGLRGRYQFTKAFSTDITLKGVGDFNPRRTRLDHQDDEKYDYSLDDGVNPNLKAKYLDGRGVIFEMIPTFSYHFGRHTITTGVDVVFTDPYVTISFPTTWTYRF